MLTLLSPARDCAVARAAIQAGADAVYIGAPRFGARQAAGNSIDDLAALVQYAHLYGVQVLATLNTLLHDDEYPEAVAMAHTLYRIGVDALIVQDLRLLEYDLPPIRLHASTQCDNRTAEQVLRLQQLGFRRVVLARELSISEIRAIHDSVLAYSAAHGEPPIELEAFVHGALCVSYSGRCYASERLLGRSANRGCCAQMCRMQYDLLDADRRELTDDEGLPIHQRYLLSLQDMNRSHSLQELIDAGVTTFKIEGRLKDEAYVTNLTAYYRQCLDALVPPAEPHRYALPFTPDPEKTFHRGGIDYFLHGRTPEMANWHTPKSTGEYIGTVVSVAHNGLRVRLREGVVLHTGDGLCVGDQGFSVNRIEGERIVPNQLPSGLQAGDRLYRNADPVFLKSLTAERRIPVRIVFRETPTGFALQIGEAEAAFVAPHEAANNPERAKATLRTQLGKLGDTPFVADTIEIASAPYFIPMGQLNEWRREVVARLIALRQTQHAARPDHRRAMTAEDTALLRTLEQAHPHDAAAADFPYPLMTCRYCLLHEMGHCRKQHPLEREPRYIRLRNQTLLRLVFDCKACEMKIDLPDPSRGGDCKEDSDLPDSASASRGGDKDLP